MVYFYFPQEQGMVCLYVRQWEGMADFHFVEGEGMEMLLSFLGKGNGTSRMSVIDHHEVFFGFSHVNRGL